MYPHERSLVKKMEGKPFALIGVNSDRDLDRLKERVEAEHITWPSFHDGGTDGPIATKWNVSGWPTLFLIDHEGVIRQHWVGSPGEDTLDAEIEKLIESAHDAH